MYESLWGRFKLLIIDKRKNERRKRTYGLSFEFFNVVGVQLRERMKLFFCNGADKASSTTWPGDIKMFRVDSYNNSYTP